MSNRQIIITLYIITAFFGLVAISTLYMQKREVAISLGAAGLLIIMLICCLGYKEFKVDKLGETLKEGQETRKRTIQEREIIKEFEAEAGELHEFTDICQLLMRKIRVLGYQAIEITPAKGTSLFAKHTGSGKGGFKG